MPLDRTWFNALVDDDGSNTVGTVWNKTQIAALLDSVDTAIAAPYCWIVYANAGGQSIGNTAWVTATFDNERTDPANMWSSGTRITVPTVGLYLISAYAVFAANATGVRGCRLVINGSFYGLPETFASALNGVPTALYVTGAINLNAGEYLELQLFQNSGAPLQAGLGFPNTQMFIVTRLS